MVVTTYKGMSLCGKEGDMVVATCKGMSLCDEIWSWPHAKGCLFVVRRHGRDHMQRDVTLW